MLKYLILYLTLFHGKIPGLLTVCINCSVSPNPQFDDKVSLLYQLGTMGDVDTIADCSVECIYDSRCHSFIYNTLRRQCIGYASSLSSPERMQAFPDDGSRAYLMCTAEGQIGHVCSSDGQCTVLNSVCLSGVCDCLPSMRYDIGNNNCVELSMFMCVTDTDCQTTNSVCYQGNCKCDVGYSYSPSDFTCVQVCSSYGDTYTCWTDVGIDENNDATGNYATAEECWESCSSDPRCRNAEYFPGDGYCSLCFSTWFELTAYQNIHDVGWTLYIRNCH